MKHLILAVTVGLLYLGSGCALPDASVLGGVFTNNVKGPVGGVDNSVKQTKAGSATATGIVLFSTGDASITAAMRAGGITKVHHIDSEAFTIMGIYSTYKTIVVGE